MSLEYEVGLTSPPLDEEKLAESIELFYENGALRVESGKRAKRFVEENFDRNVIADRFLDLLGRL